MAGPGRKCRWGGAVTGHAARSPQGSNGAGLRAPGSIPSPGGGLAAVKPPPCRRGPGCSPGGGAQAEVAGVPPEVAGWRPWPGALARQLRPARACRPGRPAPAGPSAAWGTGTGSPAGTRAKNRCAVLLASAFRSSLAMPYQRHLGIAPACCGVYQTVLEDFFLASAAAEGSARGKGVTSLVGLGAFTEERFAMHPAVPLLNGGSAQVFHLAPVSTSVVL